MSTATVVAGITAGGVEMPIVDGAAVVVATCGLLLEGDDAPLVAEPPHDAIASAAMATSRFTLTLWVTTTGRGN